MADLTAEHQNQVARYIQFFKGKRERLLADRGMEKDEFTSDRLSDDSAIFNHSDVEELLNQYHATMIGALREELVQIMDLSAVYLSQVLAQAQAFGINLDSVDVSFVEDQNRIGAIKSLGGVTAPPPAPARPTLTQLQPVAAAGTPDLAMVQEVQDLKEENRKMNERYQKMQAETSSLLQERSHLSAQLQNVQANFDVFRQQVNSSGLDSGSSANVQQIEASLRDTRVVLDSKNAEIARLSQEVNQRLGDSSQFKELKAIVKKKSDEVKVLRRAMAAHGLPVPSIEGGPGVDLAPEDD